MNDFELLNECLKPIADTEFRDLIRSLLTAEEQDALPISVDKITRGDFLGYMRQVKKLPEVREFLLRKYPDRMTGLLSSEPEGDVSQIGSKSDPGQQPPELSTTNRRPTLPGRGAGSRKLRSGGAIARTKPLTKDSRRVKNSPHTSTTSSCGPVPFVNRTEELRDLTATTTSGQCFLVYAPAGYGKSELLLRLKERFKKDLKWECGYARLNRGSDLEDVARSLAYTLKLSSPGGGQITSRSFSWSTQLTGALGHKYRANAPKGLALLIDLDQESSPDLLDALLNHFIPSVVENLFHLQAFSSNHSRIRIIIAARRRVSGSKSVDDSKRGAAIIPYALSPFDYNVVLQSTQEYLNYADHEMLSDLAAHVLHLTGGHPGCMAKILEQFCQESVNLETFLGRHTDYIHAIVNEAAATVVANLEKGHSDLRSIITETLSVLRYVDVYALRDIKDHLEKGKVRDYHDLRDRLLATSLFEMSGGFLTDSITRRLLASRLRFQSSETTLWASQCQWARELCRKRVITEAASETRPPAGNAVQWTIEYLFQTLQMSSAVQLKSLRARQDLRARFFADEVPEAMRMYLDGRKIPAEFRADEVDELLSALNDKKQWEFRFAVNFYLCGLHFSDEPYNKLEALIKTYATDPVAPTPPVATISALPRQIGEPVLSSQLQSPVTPSLQTVSWLHLSDLHFRTAKTYDADIVLQHLLEDVDKCHGEGVLHPDLILVTGDVAFSGQASEYALAGKFFDKLLQITGLPKTRLFIVPGNHDVDRGAIDLSRKTLRQGIRNRDEVNAILSQPEPRQMMMARFKGYAAFVNDYLQGHLAFDDERFFYVSTLELGKTRLALLGLNSAWVCESDDDKRNGLLIGERQVRSVLDQSRTADLKIALLHHPFDWLCEFDQQDSAIMLIDNCNFVLHGHLHRGALTQLTSPDSGAMLIAGGACYETRASPNLYNWVCLDLGVGTGTIYLRRYSDERGGFWAKDVLTYRNAPDGLYEFTSRLSAS